MNAKEAKQLDFPNLLEKMGYRPVDDGIKKGGREFWYRSPLNSGDKSPSFHITKGQQIAWVFKCFSTGAKGTIIDFVINHEGYAANDVKSALAFLTEKFPGALFEKKRTRNKQPYNPNNSFTFHQQQHSNDETTRKPLAADRELQFVGDYPLRKGSLLNYLIETRKIPINIAQQHLRLVHYKNLKNSKSYYAIGMKNRAGGFEVRSGSDKYSFKSALIARDISIIKSNSNSKSVLVFEGFMDALSFLAYINREQPPCDLVIMNSVNSYTRCVQFIKEQGYQSIHTVLDNDDTGVKCTNRFKSDFGKIVTSHSSKFAPHKDLNMALKEGMKVNFYPNQNNQDINLTP